MPADLHSNPDAATTPVDGGGFVLTNPEPEPHEPATVGELLAVGREHAGLSIGDVASRLRMSVKQVEALERADYAVLPSGTFLRGFVRNYAKAVGVNVDEALKVLERTHTDALALKATHVVAPTIAAEPVAYQPRGEALATPKSRAIITVLLVACLSAVVWYWWEFVRPHRADGGRPKETQAVVQPDLVAAVPANAAAVPEPSASTAAAGDPQPAAASAISTAMPIDPNIATGVSLPPTSSPISTPLVAPASPATAKTAAVPLLGAPLTSKPTPSEKTAGKATDKVTDGVADKVTDKVSDKLTERASAPPDNAKAKRGESGVIGFTFSGESWVEVTDATGRTIMSRRYKAGEADEVTGKGPFSVVVGNAASTRMAVNGREFDLAPHTRATVARVTVK